MLGTVKSIGKAIKTIVNFITTCFDLIMSFVRQIGYLLTTLSKVANICKDTILYLPDWLKLFATLTITISILYLILGRNQGDS